MKLHIGAGARIIPGWINVDAEPPAEVICDVRQGLPFGTGCATHVYSEHFLEHLTRDEGVAVLRECARVLKPGGCVRISVPSLSRLVSAYLEKDTQFAAAVGWTPATPCQMLNEGMRAWSHKFLMDEDELTLMLQESGFIRIRRAAYQETAFTDMVTEGRPNFGDLIMEACAE